MMLLFSPVFFCNVKRGWAASCTGKVRGKRQPGAVARIGNPGHCFAWGTLLVWMVLGSQGITELCWWGMEGEEPPRQLHGGAGWAWSEQGGGGSDRRQNWHNNITAPAALKSQLVSPTSFHLSQWELGRGGPWWLGILWHLCTAHGQYVPLWPINQSIMKIRGCTSIQQNIWNF